MGNSQRRVLEKDSVPDTAEIEAGNVEELDGAGMTRPQESFFGKK